MLEKPTPITLENNLGPDVDGFVHRVPWLAYDKDEMDSYLDKVDKSHRDTVERLMKRAAKDSRVPFASWDAYLPREVVDILCGFFMDVARCRSYPVDIPLGKIADRAYKHWDAYDKKIAEFRATAQMAEEHSRSLCSRIYELETKVAELKDFSRKQAACIRKERKNRYLAMADKCCAKLGRLQSYLAGDCAEPDKVSLLIRFKERQVDRWTRLAELMDGARGADD